MTRSVHENCYIFQCGVHRIVFAHSFSRIAPYILHKHTLAFDGWMCAIHGLFNSQPKSTETTVGQLEIDLIRSVVRARVSSRLGSSTMCAIFVFSHFIGKLHSERAIAFHPWNFRIHHYYGFFFSVSVKYIFITSFSAAANEKQKQKKDREQKQIIWNPRDFNSATFQCDGARAELETRMSRTKSTSMNRKGHVLLRLWRHCDTKRLHIISHKSLLISTAASRCFTKSRECCVFAAVAIGMRETIVAYVLHMWRIIPSSLGVWCHQRAE